MSNFESRRKVEFVIPAKEAAEVKELKDHVSQLFDVSISFSSDPSSVSRTGIEWVHILGNKKDPEFAKDYIIAVCTPEDIRTISVPHSLEGEFSGKNNTILYQQERKHRTVVKFCPGVGICVKGKSDTVALVVSYLEEKIEMLSKKIATFGSTATFEESNNKEIDMDLRLYCKRLGFSDSQIATVASKCGTSLNENSFVQELLIHHRGKILNNENMEATSNLGQKIYTEKQGLEEIGETQSIGETSSLGAIKDTKEDQVELRHIVVDGSNVAMCHGNKEIFSCKGIQLCVDWFKNRGHHNITVIVPQWRKELPKTESPIHDQEILLRLEKERILVFTPSRRVNGRRVVCYDDRYIVKVAAEEDGIIVSNDHFRDIEKESPEYKQVIDEHLLMYSFVNDKFMPPDDPLGRHGPSLDDFLKKGKPLRPKLCPYGRRCTYGQKCRYYHPEKQSNNLIGQSIETDFGIDRQGQFSSLRGLNSKATVSSTLLDEKNQTVHNGGNDLNKKQVLRPSGSNTTPARFCTVEANNSLADLNNTDVVARGRQLLNKTDNLQNDKHSHVMERVSRQNMTGGGKKPLDKFDNSCIRNFNEESRVTLGPNMKGLVLESSLKGQEYSHVVLRGSPPKDYLYQQQNLEHRKNYYAENKPAENNQKVSYEGYGAVPTNNQDIFQRTMGTNLKGINPSRPRPTEKAILVPFQNPCAPQAMIGGYSKVPYVPHPLVCYTNDPLLRGQHQFISLPRQRFINTQDRSYFTLYQGGDVNSQNYAYITPDHMFYELQRRFPGQNERIVCVLREHPYETSIERLTWLIENHRIR